MPQQFASQPADNVARLVSKLERRRRRSGYAAWVFIASAAILVVTLILTKGDTPGLVFAAFGLVLVWTIVESALLAASVCVSKNAVFLVPFGGFCTYGAVSVIAIFVLRPKGIRELALAKMSNQQLLQMVARDKSLGPLGHFGEVKAELEKRNLAPAAVAPVTEAAGASNQNSDNTDKREQARACWEVKFADGSVHSLSEEKEIVGAIMADEIKPDYECRRVTGLANAAKAQEIRWKRVSESLARSSFAIRTLFQPVWAHTVRGAEIGALMGLVFWFGSGVFVLIARAFALAPLNVNRSAAGFDYFVAAGLVYIF